MATIRELVAKIGLEVDGEGFKVAEGLFHGLHTGALALGVGVVGAVGAFFELGRETANAGFEAYKSAQRMGVTTDAAQELKFAADEAGVSFESLQTMMFRMSRAAYEAKRGSTAAAEGFRGLVSLGDLKTKTPDQLLEAMATGLQKIKDPQERAAKLIAVFGRGAMEILPLLDQGAEGIRKFREEAHELGIVLSEEDIAQAKEFRLEMKHFGAQMEGLKYSVGRVALGAMISLGKAFGAVKKVITDFKKAHPDAWALLVTLAVSALTAATIRWAIIHAGAMLVGAGGWAALGKSAVTAGWASVKAWTAMLFPIVALAAGLATIYYWFDDLNGFFQGKDSVIGDFVNALSEVKGGPWEKLKVFLKAQFDAILDFLPDSFFGAGERSVESFVAGFKKKALQVMMPGMYDIYEKAGMFGPNASAPPQAPVVQSPAVGGGISAPVQNTYNLEINGAPNMSKPEWHDLISQAVSQAHEEHEQNQSRIDFSQAP